MTAEREKRTSENGTVGTAFATLLNALVDMQASPAYAVRKGVLAEAEQTILALEKKANENAEAARKAESQYVGSDGWNPMHTAPLDGTEIEILFRHFDYWTCLKLKGKEQAEAEYQAVQKAHWIDHNAGGWTWHGMAGSAMAWRPIRECEPRE